MASLVDDYFDLPFLEHSFPHSGTVLLWIHVEDWVIDVVDFPLHHRERDGLAVLLPLLKSLSGNKGRYVLWSSLVF